MDASQQIPDRHPDLLTVGSTAILVVDIQEKFRKYISGFDEIVERTKLLLEGAAVFGVPVLVSEQYPKGLGQTVPELQPHIEGAATFEKMAMSSACAREFSNAAQGVPEDATWLVVGIEAHVCVSQTVLDLLHQGKRVHVAADAIGSHDPRNKAVAVERFRSAGATVTTVETALFELMVRAGTDEFKAVQRLIKDFLAHEREPVGFSA